MEELATHYAVLGVAEDAAYAQIRCNYLSSLITLHPDKQQPHDDEEAPPLSSSFFLRLQEAWNVLKDPQSRSTYDRHLASTRLLLAPSVAEDVLLEEMSSDCEDAQVGPSYVYPCRCGDCYLVSLQELIDLGLSGKVSTQDSSASKDSSKQQQVYLGCLRDNNSHGLHVHDRKSMILPCGSCSLRIRLVL